MGNIFICIQVFRVLADLSDISNLFINAKILTSTHLLPTEKNLISTKSSTSVKSSIFAKSLVINEKIDR